MEGAGTDTPACRNGHRRRGVSTFVLTRPGLRLLSAVLAMLLYAGVSVPPASPRTDVSQ